MSSLGRIVMGVGTIVFFTFAGAMARGILQISYQTRNGTLDGFSSAYFLLDVLGLIVGLVVAAWISRKLQRKTP